MTLRVSGLQSESDMDGIRNSCNVLMDPSGKSVSNMQDSIEKGKSGVKNHHHQNANSPYLEAAVMEPAPYCFRRVFVVSVKRQILIHPFCQCLCGEVGFALLMCIGPDKVTEFLPELGIYYRSYGF